MVPDVHDLPEKSTVPAASQYLIKIYRDTVFIANEET